MSRTAEEWGRVAVALPGWCWMPGMRGIAASGRTDRIMDYTEAAQPNRDILPDPDDPATAGCLLALVAEAYGVTLDDVHVVRTTGMVWSVWIFRADDSSYRVATHEPSRAEALVAALEAAP